MHEQEKLNEARYFAQRMQSSINDPVAFKYELSAFLSAARSVLQYALKEAERKAEKSWYDSRVCGNAVLKFFKDKRNLNTHAEPVRPSRQSEIAIKECVTVSESIRIEMQKGDGATEINECKEEPPVSKPPESAVEVAIFRYTFQDWEGSEDVISLSSQYLAALEDFVNAGVSRGIISG